MTLIFKLQHAAGADHGKSEMSIKCTDYSKNTPVHVFANYLPFIDSVLCINKKNLKENMKATKKTPRTPLW